MKVLRRLPFLLFFVVSGPVLGRPAEPPWNYEWNADEVPEPSSDFTFRGVLIARREAEPVNSRPADGTRYLVGDPIGAAEAVYLGLGNPRFTRAIWCDSGLLDEHTYYFKFFSYDSDWNYSTGVGTGAVIVGATPTPCAYGTPLSAAPPALGSTGGKKNPGLSAPTPAPLPPDVEFLYAWTYSGGACLEWVNPRDTVGWGCEGSDCCRAEGGIVVLDTDTLDGPRKSWYTKDAALVGSYTVEFRMKVLSSPDLDGRLRFRSVAARSGGNVGVNVIALDLAEDRVRMTRGYSEVFDLDTTDAFHVYRIVSTGGYGYFYVDGRYRGGGRLSNQNPEFSGINFGDAVGGGSRSEWDYIKYAFGAYFYPTPSPTPTSSPTPTRSPSPLPSPSPIFLVLASGDYNGDGRSDLAVFRPERSKWMVRNLGNSWFGREGDVPVPGDYDGDGVTDIGVYRPADGLWAVKGLTRFHLEAGLVPVPADYDGDGVADAGVFRASDGLWTIRGRTRVGFGQAFDLPVPGDYDGDGTDDIAVWRPASGLWAVRGLTREFYGCASDVPVPGRYVWDGGSAVRVRPAVFRPGRGKWMVLDGESFYLGSSGDIPLPGAYAGGVLDRAAVFRPARGFWAVRGLTRAHFGQPGDYPVAR